MTDEKLLTAREVADRLMVTGPIGGGKPGAAVRTFSGVGRARFSAAGAVQRGDSFPGRSVWARTLD